MKLEALINRADELIKLGERALAGSHMSSQFSVGNHIDNINFNEFRTASLAFIERTFGSRSPHFSEFDTRVGGSAALFIASGIGILKGCRSELAGGWLTSTRGLVSAELFSDFLSMAEHLLKENYKDAAAVLVGGVLEEHLRQLCTKNSIAVVLANGAPLKADTMNSELAKAGVYLKLDLKNVTAWLDLRNKAAHAKYSDYNDSQVDLMLRGVSDFLARTPL